MTRVNRIASPVVRGAALGAFVGCVKPEAQPERAAEPTPAVAEQPAAAPAQPVAPAGQAVFDSKCARCHSAGQHDTTGGAGDLAGEGDEALRMVACGHKRNRLTEAQQADLAAFLNGLK